MHYNALFKTPLPTAHPAANSQSLLYVLNDGGLGVGDALHQIGHRLDQFGALVHEHLDFHLLRLADVAERVETSLKLSRQSAQVGKGWFCGD